MTKRAATADPLSDQLAVGQPELAGPVDAYPDELPELMTSPEVAAALRITPDRVRRYVSAGVLPAYKVGRELRIPRTAVVAHLNSLRIAR